MNRWRVILAVVTIFVAGAATGAVIVRTYAPRIVKRTHVSPPLPIGNDRRQEYVAKLDRELQLTSEQRAKIETILMDSQKRMKELWEPMEPQVKEEYRRSRREISEALTPEQQEKMKQWRKDRDGHRDRNDKSGEKMEKSENGDKADKVELQKRCGSMNCCL